MSACRYDGEVSIAQDQLNSFLAAAEDLKVKGLTQNNAGESHNNSNRTAKNSVVNPWKQNTPKPKPSYETHEYLTSTARENDDDIQEIKAVKAEPSSHQPDYNYGQSSGSGNYDTQLAEADPMVAYEEGEGMYDGDQAYMDDPNTAKGNYLSNIFDGIGVDGFDQMQINLK